MTNKEWISVISSEKATDILDWVFHEYGRRFISTRSGVIEWLDAEHVGSEVGTCPYCMYAMRAASVRENRCNHCGYLEEV